MSDYVQHVCSKCGAGGLVSTDDIIQKRKNIMPDGWARMDIGDEGPEVYKLCHDCLLAWRTNWHSLLREFTGDTHA